MPSIMDDQCWLVICKPRWTLLEGKKWAIKIGPSWSLSNGDEGLYTLLRWKKSEAGEWENGMDFELLTLMCGLVWSLMGRF